MRNHAQAGLSFAPLTPDRWRDVVQLFGSRGACGGCWCMAWRLPKQRYEAGKGNGNRRRFRALVSADGHDGHCPPGVLAYREEGSDARVPIGWCAVAPREAYVRLESARALKRLDTKPVWSIRACSSRDRTDTAASRWHCSKPPRISLARTGRRQRRLSGRAAHRHYAGCVRVDRHGRGVPGGGLP